MRTAPDLRTWCKSGAAVASLRNGDSLRPAVADGEEGDEGEHEHEGSTEQLQQDGYLMAGVW